MPPVSTRARHSSQTRNALPPVRSVIARASSGGPSPASPPRRADEIRHLVAREAAEPQADDLVGAAQVGERLRERPGTSASVSRKVAITSSRPLAGGACQVPQQEQGRPVGPVPVLEHQDDGAASRLRPTRRSNDGRMQAVTLGVGIRLDRRSQVAEPKPHSPATERVSSPPPCTERRPAIRPGRCSSQAGPALRRTAHKGVRTTASQAAGGRGRRPPSASSGELADETALARSGLAAGPGPADRSPPRALGINTRSVSNSAARPTNGKGRGRRESDREGQASGRSRSDHSQI